VCKKKDFSDLIAIFEDDGETGYLYVFDASNGMILQYLQIYDDAQNLTVGSGDVQVIWSKDYSKCGVLIWHKMRGIVDCARKKEGRVKLENRDTHGIDDMEWLQGFEYNTFKN
jgi:hypothetical protein